LRRYPRGYLGTNHQALGSDILAAIATVPMTGQVLGAELAAELREVKPDQWYPIDLFLRVQDKIDARVGRFGLLQLGRKLFRASHVEQFKKVASSAADVVYSFDEMYRRVNRGTHIGGWEVVIFRPGLAELLKTTPSHCVMAEGIISEALVTLKIPATVEQTTCIRQGAGECRFILRSAVSDEKWMGGRKAVG
jgi:hypothetical protein